MKRIFSLAMCFIMLLSLLSSCKGEEKGEGNTVATDAEDGTSAELLIDDEDMFSSRDRDGTYDEAVAVVIELLGESARASSDSVEIADSRITLREEGVYIISGELSDGSITVDAAADAKLQLVLNGAKINCESSSPLYILSADKVFVTLANESENYLSNGGEFVSTDDNNIDGAIFSKEDLTLNGSGSLEVSSPQGHGIVSKDDLVITGGTYTVNSASHGLDANDSVRIENACISIDAGKDAIHSENNDDTSKGFVYISSGEIVATVRGDGISAGSHMKISGASFQLNCGGGAENSEKASSDDYGNFMGGGHGQRPGGGPMGGFESSTEVTDESSTSMKGLKAGGELLILGGEFNIDSADDSFHSNSSLTVKGGTFNIASGDDAFHADDTLSVAGGKIDISESYEGLEGLHVNISGGDIKLVCDDDGINAAGGADQSGTQGGRDGMFGGPGGMSTNSDGTIKISGGNININASGDGIDANGTLEITGGGIVVSGPTQGDTATLDFDKSAVISGGTFIGTGAGGMAQTFDDSPQGVIAYSVGNQSAGTKITVMDKKGNTLIEHTPELDFAVIIISSPEIEKGETYSVTIGTQSAEFEAY